MYSSGLDRLDFYHRRAVKILSNSFLQFGVSCPRNAILAKRTYANEVVTRTNNAIAKNSNLGHSSSTYHILQPEPRHVDARTPSVYPYAGLSDFYRRICNGEYFFDIDQS